MTDNIDNWTDIQMNNVYKLYCACELYELDSPMSFEEFKKNLIEDPEFKTRHYPKPGMETEDYDPWRISE